MNDEAEALAALIALDEPSIRAHLAGPDPTRRLHAAWALGLRARDGGAAAARRLLTAEPHAGVRRHLAVMLGGDLEALGALLDLDPSERVRETALRLAAQSWPSHGHAHLATRVLEESRGDASADVRLAAIELLEGLLPHVETDALVAVLEAQREAADARLAWATVRLLAQRGDPLAVRTLVSWSVKAEPEARARSWQLVGPTRSILEALRALRALGRDEEVPVGIVREALELCLEDASVTFAEVAWIDGLGLDDELLRVVRAETLPHAWLLVRARYVLRDHEGWLGWSALRALSSLGQAGARIDAASEVELATLRADLETDGDPWPSAEQEQAWDEPEPGRMRREILEGLAALARRAPPR